MIRKKLVRQLTFLGCERVLPLFPVREAILVSDQEYQWFRDLFAPKYHKKLQKQIKDPTKDQLEIQITATETVLSPEQPQSPVRTQKLALAASSDLTLPEIWEPTDLLEQLRLETYFNAIRTARLLLKHHSMTVQETSLLVRELSKFPGFQGQLQVMGMHNFRRLVAALELRSVAKG